MLVFSSNIPLGTFNPLDRVTISRNTRELATDHSQPSNTYINYISYYKPLTHLLLIDVFDSHIMVHQLHSGEL